MTCELRACDKVATFVLVQVETCNSMWPGSDRKKKVHLRFHQGQTLGQMLCCVSSLHFWTPIRSFQGRRQAKLLTTSWFIYFCLSARDLYQCGSQLCIFVLHAWHTPFGRDFFFRLRHSSTLRFLAFCGH